MGLSAGRTGFLMSGGVIDAIDRCVGARGCCVVDDNHRLARRVAAAIMAIVPVPEAPWSQRRSGRRHAGGDLCMPSRVGEPRRLGSSVTGVLANSREKNGYLRRRYPLYRRRRRNPLSSVRSGTSWGAQTTVQRSHRRRPRRRAGHGPPKSARGLLRAEPRRGLVSNQTCRMHVRAGDVLVGSPLGCSLNHCFWAPLTPLTGPGPALLPPPGRPMCDLAGVYRRVKSCRGEERYGRAPQRAGVEPVRVQTQHVLVEHLRADFEDSSSRRASVRYRRVAWICEGSSNASWIFVARDNCCGVQGLGGVEGGEPLVDPGDAIRTRSGTGARRCRRRRLRRAGPSRAHAASWCASVSV